VTAARAATGAPRTAPPRPGAVGRRGRPAATPAPARGRDRPTPTAQDQPEWPRPPPGPTAHQAAPPAAAPELEPGHLPIDPVGDRAGVDQQGAGQALAGRQQRRPGQPERERHQRHQIGRRSQRGQDHRQPGRQRPVEQAADRPIGVLGQRAAQRPLRRPHVLGVSTSCHQQPAGRATARSGWVWARRVTAPARLWSPSLAAWRWRPKTSAGSRNPPQSIPGSSRCLPKATTAPSTTRTRVPFPQAGRSGRDR
jgi:hypothetical protein